VISREIRIGRTDPAGCHQLAVASNTDKGRAWYIPTARVTTPQLVSRPANRQTRATCGPGSCAAVLTLTGAAPGTYPRPQSRYLSTCHGKPNLKLHRRSTRATCGPGAGAAGLTRTGAAPGTYPRPQSTHIGRAHTQTGAVPGTYPRPRSRAVRLILETLSGTPIDPPGAGRPNCEALEKKSHAEHAQETTRYGGLTRRAIGSLTSGPTSGTGKSAGRNFTN
jgi:hypothetical protein